jgi:hypothetical protein
MTFHQFEDISLYLGIGGLVLYMVFIMYKLGKESGAGGYGMLIIFTSLGLGIVGFGVKSVIQMLVQV